MDYKIGSCTTTLAYRMQRDPILTSAAGTHAAIPVQTPRDVYRPRQLPRRVEPLRPTNTINYLA